MNLNKIKKISVGILMGGFLLMSAFTSYYIKAYTKANDLSSYMKDRNEILMEERDSIHNLYLESNILQEQLSSLLDNSLGREEALKLENNQLQLMLTNIENEMENITSDSSYIYLMQRHMPTQDSLPYRFAPNQVSAMHSDLLTLDQTQLINNNLIKQLSAKDISYFLLNSKFNLCEEQKVLLLMENSKVQNMYDNLDLINKAAKKETKKYKTTTIAASTGLGIVIIYEVVKVASKLFK